MKPLLPDVTVNGEPIPAAMIAAEAQNHPAPPGKPGLAWKAAAQALAIRALLLQEAARRGLAPDPQELAPGQFETDEEALVRQILAASVVQRPVTDAEVRAEYNAQPERFRAPTLYEAAHILLPIAAPEAAAEVEGLAAMLVEELGARPQLFADLARAHSVCASAANGGHLGQITAGDTVPEFEAALATIAEGTIHPAPVRSRYGLHIIRLDARAQGAILPFERIAGPLRRAMEQKAWAAAARTFVQELVDRAEISGAGLKAA